MNTCDCFYKIFGKSRCYGTKEMEECSCGGDEAKCNFYPDVRFRAKEEKGPVDISDLTQLLISKGYELTICPGFCPNVVMFKLRNEDNTYGINRELHLPNNTRYDANGAIYNVFASMIREMNSALQKNTSNYDFRDYSGLLCD